MAIENRKRDAFVARRTQPIKKGSRELRVIPPKWRDNFAQSDFAEWKKWLSYDAVERPKPEELVGLEKNDVLTFRMIRTDKNEATRGGKSYQEHPLKAKSRGVLPPEGTILKAKKGVYGLNDAPLLWYLEHRDTILSLEGAEKSKLCPALFLFRDPTTKKLLGMIGILVDDDLILGSKQFFENQVAQLRKMHCYGKWHTSVEGFFHCGRFVQKQADGSLKCGQNEYVESLMPIHISKERRLNKGARATPSEREALQSGNGKLAWLVRSSRMDLAFRLVESQTRAQDTDLSVKDLLAYN